MYRGCRSGLPNRLARDAVDRIRKRGGVAYPKDYVVAALDPLTLAFLHHRVDDSLPVDDGLDPARSDRFDSEFDRIAALNDCGLLNAGGARLNAGWARFLR